jgi:hypothetical protein
MRPHLLLGQAALEPGPVLAAVGGLVDAALVATGDDGGKVALALVRHGVQHVGIPRIHVQLPTTRVIAGTQHVVPGLAAVGGLVDPAIATGLTVRTVGSDPHGVRILGVDHDLTDLLAFLETSLLPTLAGIAAAVDPIARHQVGVGVVLAGSHPDHVRIRRIEGHRADGERRLPVEDRGEGGAPVDRLPQRTVPGRDVVLRRVARIDIDVDDPAAGDRGADTPEGQPIQRRLRQRHGTVVGFGILGLLLRGERGQRVAHEEAQQRDEAV